MRSVIEINGNTLDLYEDTPMPITYTIGDIREPDTRQTSYSKTITIPGTANNNKLFTHIFEISKHIDESSFTAQFSPDFNPNLRANAVLFIDDIEILRGYLQLVRIIKKRGQIDYECVVYASLNDLFKSIENLDLNQLDLSEYNHIYDYTHVYNSWGTSIVQNGIDVAFSYGNGYVYPFIDYGFNNGVTTKTEHFYPAIYAKTIIDKIFEYAGFTYTSTFLDSSLVSHLIVPYNRGVAKLTDEEVFLRKFNVYQSYYTQPTFETNNGGTPPFSGNTFTAWASYAILKHQQVNYDNGVPLKNYDLTEGVFVCRKPAKYKFTVKYKWDVNLNISATHKDNPYNSTSLLYRFNVTNPNSETVKVKIDFVRWESDTNLYSTLETLYTSELEVFSGAGVTQLGIINQNINGGLLSGSMTTSSAYTMLPNDKLYLRITPIQSGDIDVQTSWVSLSPFDEQPWNYQSCVWKLIEDSSYFVDNLYYDEIDNTQLTVGNEINLSNFLPDKIKAGEFLKSFFKCFNLYARVDKSDDTNLIIETRDDFYTNDVVDWSSKVDYNKDIEVIPMAELGGNKYNFTFTDDNDFYNQKYKEDNLKTFGRAKVYVVNDFNKDTIEIKPSFSPTINVPSSLNNRMRPCLIAYDKGAAVANDNVNDNVTLPHGSGVKKGTDTNCRLLYYAGLIATDGWTMDGNGMNYYPQAATIDDYTNPTLLLDFDNSESGYFTGIYQTSNTLFNKYWRNFINSITSPDSKLVTLYISLKPIDILKLDFKKLYRIEGDYFRLNKIYDYDPLTNESCKVELIKAIEPAPFIGTGTLAPAAVRHYNYIEGGLDEVRSLGATSSYNYVEGGLNEVRNLGATSIVNTINGSQDNV